MATRQFPIGLRIWSIAAPLLLFLLPACDSIDARLAPLGEDATILAFGNSLTWGTGAAREASYPSVLARLSGRRVINAGVPGEVSADGLTRLRGTLNRHDVDLVILCHGGNDMLRKLDTRALAKNLQSMITTIHEHGAQVVLVGVPKPGLLLGTADVYLELASSNGLVAELDVITDVLSKASLKSDPIHPNDAGYRHVAVSLHELLTASGAY